MTRRMFGKALLATVALGGLLGRAAKALALRSKPAEALNGHPVARNNRPRVNDGPWITAHSDPWSSAPAAPHVWYVHPSGRDEPGWGESKEKPFASIGYAIDRCELCERAGRWEIRVFAHDDGKTFVTGKVIRKGLTR